MKKDPYKYEPHKSFKLGNLPWEYCGRCGLIFLKNDISRLCKKLGCDYENHSTYIHARKKAKHFK